MLCSFSWFPMPESIPTNELSFDLFRLYRVNIDTFALDGYLLPVINYLTLTNKDHEVLLLS